MYVRATVILILVMALLNACQLPFSPQNQAYDSIAPTQSDVDKSLLLIPLQENSSPNAMTYIVQQGTPAWLPNYSHPDAGCSWLGIAGQAFDLNSKPVKNLIVEIGGNFEGIDKQLLSLTGLAPMYGEGGYEIALSDHVSNSHQSLWIQIRDLASGTLSEKVYFDTFADCQKNLILINFAQVSTPGVLNFHFFPMVYKSK